MSVLPKLLLAVGLMHGAAAVVGQEVVYVPSDPSVGGMSVEQARRTIADLASGQHSFVVEGGIRGVGPDFRATFKNKITGVSLNEERIVIEYVGGKLALDLGELPKIEVTKNSDTFWLSTRWSSAATRRAGSGEEMAAYRSIA